MQILYQAEIGRFPVADVLTRVRGERAREEWTFIDPLVRDAGSRRRALDRAIAPHLRGWDLSRLSAVDRIILRLAVAELQRGETPPRVVLNEAVELAKRFGGQGSPRFVNGVLGGFLRQEGPTEHPVLPKERERSRR